MWGVAGQRAWVRSGAPRGDEYEAQLAARLRGRNPHGEVDFVEDVLRRVKVDWHQPPLILDGGCGTGRVAIELARRGYLIVGVDSDPAMLAVAQRNAPELHWQLADLADVQLEEHPNVIVLAGNVMIFLDRGQEAAVLQNLAGQLVPGGLFIVGFQLGSGLALERYDELATSAGLRLLERWATWDRAPWNSTTAYAVSVHQRERACESDRQ